MHRLKGPWPVWHHSWHVRLEGISAPQRCRVSNTRGIPKVLKQLLFFFKSYNTWEACRWRGKRFCWMSAEGTLGWESCQRNKQINVAQLMWITFPQGTLGFSWVYAMSSEIWRSSGEKKDMFGCNSKVGHVKRLYWPQKYTNSLHSIKYPCLYIFLECQKNG